MIKEFVDLFMEGKPKLQSFFSESHPEDYESIIRAVVEQLDNGKDNAIDPSRIHEIDDGAYQGVLIYVIGEKGYQPQRYWYVKVSYGSCSGSDTLEQIKSYSSGKPNDEQVKQYMTLALHIVQGLKEMGGDIAY